jgi:Tol biopolymer transport system component
MPYDPFFSHGITRKTIGFVDADGNQRELFNFLIAGGSAFYRPKHFSTYAIEPQWSGNGDSLAFYIADVAPSLRLIDDQGYMHGKGCEDIFIQDFGFDGSGNVVAWMSRTDPFFEIYGGDIEEDEQLFIRYDVINCQVVDLFTVPIPENYRISGVSISKDGVLTCMIKEVVMYTYQEPEKPHSVFIYNLETEEKQTFPGFHPSLSDDGSLLAYYGYNGELIIRDMESNGERVLKRIFKYDDFDDLVSRPGWSPDNQWLVYNTQEGEIYKINVNTRENVYLADGYTPDWK